MVSSALAQVQAIDSTQHMAIILDPLGAGNGPEIAWITAHTASSTGATIVRGREGSSGVAHTSTTAWVHGPTAADHVMRVTSATRPSGTGLPFEGQLIYETDTDRVAQYTGSAWRYIGAGNNFVLTGTHTDTHALDSDDTGTVSFGVTFASAPVVVGTVRVGSNTDLILNWTAAPTTTGVAFRVVQKDNVAWAETYYIYWVAVGPLI